jgi:hypothetical protein
MFAFVVGETKTLTNVRLTRMLIVERDGAAGDLHPLFHQSQDGGKGGRKFAPLRERFADLKEKRQSTHPAFPAVAVREVIEFLECLVPHKMP